MLGFLLDGLWPLKESSISSDMKISFRLYICMFVYLSPGLSWWFSWDLCLSFLGYFSNIWFPPGWVDVGRTCGVWDVGLPVGSLQLSCGTGWGEGRQIRSGKWMWDLARSENWEDCLDGKSQEALTVLDTGEGCGWYEHMKRLEQ